MQWNVEFVFRGEGIAIRRGFLGVRRMSRRRLGNDRCLRGMLPSTDNWSPNIS